MRTSMLFLVFPVLLITIGCNSEKKVAGQTSAAEPVVPAVEKQPTAAPVAMVQEQPTMFEWRGIHDGMTLAEFQAKDGRNCAETRQGIACVNTEVDQYQSLSALFRHGQVYSFRVECDGPGDYREYQDRCKSVVAAVTAHFGKPISDNVKHGARAIMWRSELELALYMPPVSGGESVGSLEVCSPVLSASGECHPD
jgi:hypothetical protein